MRKYLLLIGLALPASLAAQVFADRGPPAACHARPQGVRQPSPALDARRDLRAVARRATRRETRSRTRRA